MNIWIVFIGEEFPVDGNVREWRYGILANLLSSQEHHVTIWAPTFMHGYKKQRFLNDRCVEINDNFKIRFLYTKGYQNNISLNRMRFDLQLSRVFARRILNEDPPDIILAGLPTPELCYVAVRYAKKKNIPIILDVRDLWPDIFLGVVPNYLRWIAKLFLWPLFRMNHTSFQKATAIFAVSPSYLKWGLRFANRKPTEDDAVFPIGYKELALDDDQIRIEREFLLKAGIDESRIICCFAGQLERTYDLETVIEVARILEDNDTSKFQFVFCGDGSKRKSLCEKATGLKNTVFLGRVAPSTIKALMSVSDIGLASYSKDAPQSLPNKPFEYFSGGLLVLSTLNGDLKPILSRNGCGLNYSAGNIGELSGILKYLSNHPEVRKQMKLNARRLYEEKYSDTKIYPDMANQLQSILKKSQHIN
jgi:glycosyltransferase involved in cell wall biosynthesis